MKLVPSISMRSSVISRTMDGLLRNRGISKRHQVRKFPRRNTKLVLILARQHAYEKAIFGVFQANTLNKLSIRIADAVSRVPQPRIHRFSRADHH